MREFIDRRELRRKAADILRYASSEQDPIEMAKTMVSLIDNAQTVAKDMDVPTTQGWISVDDEMPAEHDSIFKEYYGTERWHQGMFRKLSDDVNVALEYPDGTKAVTTFKTHDGEWDISIICQAKITHWMPLPQPPADEWRCDRTDMSIKS